ncbi:hypothetical protein IFR05_001083 [Cadophora sp. M221]|nr:hypothetical protein IFR05_001083 [Cadophora sp. M221]
MLPGFPRGPGLFPGRGFRPNALPQQPLNVGLVPNTMFQQQPQQLQQHNIQQPNLQQSNLLVPNIQQGNPFAQQPFQQQVATPQYPQQPQQLQNPPYPQSQAQFQNFQPIQQQQQLQQQQQAPAATLQPGRITPSDLLAAVAYNMRVSLPAAQSLMDTLALQQKIVFLPSSAMYLVNDQLVLAAIAEWAGAGMQGREEAAGAGGGGNGGEGGRGGGCDKCEREKGGCRDCDRERRRGR